MSRLPLVGKDPAFRAAVALARRVAAGRSPVLIVGPTGSGKTHLARLIHQWGGHPKTDLVEWHGGAVPEALLEAELFGIRSGAATGVEQRAGIFESAGRGTLCLEGVEHLKPHQQAALLRLLEGQPFERIGGGAPMRLEARLIALFQDPPETLIERSLLRADLLYRLDVIRIELPPLFQRAGDVLPLAEHFLRAACRKARLPVPEIAPELEKAFGDYAWPGNLRELAQRMEALSMSGEARLTPELLPPSFWSGPAPLEEGLARRLTLAEMKDAYIRAVLARVGGNRSRAARWLGVSRKALWAHLRRGEK